LVVVSASVVAAVVVSATLDEAVTLPQLASVKAARNAIIASGFFIDIISFYFISPSFI
jgi:hypothetical protein